MLTEGSPFHGNNHGMLPTSGSSGGPGGDDDDRDEGDDGDDGGDDPRSFSFRGHVENGRRRRFRRWWRRRGRAIAGWLF